MSDFISWSYVDGIAYDGPVAVITLTNPEKRNTLAGLLASLDPPHAASQI